MSDPIWSAEDVTALKAAIASGVLSVSYNGPPARTITYQSLAEMRALLAEMTASVNESPRYRLASFKSGF